MLAKENVFSLNSLSKNLKEWLNFSEITFYNGEILSKTAEVCREICPYSKVIVLFAQPTFDKVGEEFTSILKDNGLTPISLIVDKDEFEKSNQQILFSIPENVRTCVTLDYSLITSCLELSKDKRLECVIGFNQAPLKLFSLYPPNARLVFSDQLIINDSLIYQSVVSKIISLLDIKLKQFFKIIPKNYAIGDLFVEILQKALTVKHFLEPNESQRILEYFLSLELIETALNHFSENYELKTSLCIIKLISVGLTKEFYAAPNYLARAKALEKLYGISYLSGLEAFKSQLDQAKLYQEHLEDIKKGLSVLAGEYLKLAPKIVFTYKRLGGRTERPNKEILQTIKYAGDKHYYNNILSLLRENGCLEQIK